MPAKSLRKISLLNKGIIPVNDGGFTLVEVLIATAVIAVIGLSILGTIILFSKYSQESKEKVQAQNLANQQIELLHNMPYDSLATINGPIYPPGTLPDVQTMTVDGQQFKVHTYISYVDDPFDGNAAGTIPGKPVDLYPYDYKKITIIVKDKYDSLLLAQTTTNIAGKAAETATNTGILSLKVQNAQGQPVPNANVVLTNPNQTPPVNITTFTDVNGLVLIPSLPPSSANDYHVVASLSGYSTDSTYPAFAPNNLNPVLKDFNILVQQITPITLSIDTVATMNITVTDTTGAVVPNLQLNLKGAKLTYTSPNTYKFNQNFTTNGSGVINITNMEWDSYTIAVPAGYYIVSTNPYQTVDINPSDTLNVSLVVTTDNSYPTITSVSPLSGINSSSVSVTITGTNLPSGSTVKLTLSGQPDINGTGIVSSGGNTILTGNFDLTSVAPGGWNIVVTTPSGKVATQPAGFTVTP